MDTQVVASDTRQPKPREAVPAEDAPIFTCAHAAIRSLRQAKGVDYRATELADGSACCDGDSGCS